MIKLNEEYSVKVSPYAYTLVHYKGVSRKGTELWAPVGHYGTLRAAVRACITDMNRRKLTEDTFTLWEAVEVLRESEKVLADMLEKVGIKND